MKTTRDYYELIKENGINKFEKYLYYRGYLISDKPYTVQAHWKILKFGVKKTYYLTYDPQNECCYIEKNGKAILLLGLVLDTLSWSINLHHIAEKILKKFIISQELMYNYIDDLAGRYIIALDDGDKIIILQDATGMRSVAYSKKHVLISSHYSLIHQVTPHNHHPYFDKYLKYEKLPWTLPGNITPYLDIMILTPNHELQLPKMIIKRFWPRKEHQDLTVDYAVDYISNNIKKQIWTLAKFHKLMVQLTAGNDSRITLSATRFIKDEIYYWTYTPAQDIMDIEIPSKLAEENDLSFSVINIKRTLQEEEHKHLLSVARINNYHEHNYTNIESYFKYLPKDRINIRSNIIEIIRDSHNQEIYSFDLSTNKSKGYFLASTSMQSQYIRDAEAIKIFNDYEKEYDYTNIYNYNLCDLMYWEYRMGIWMNNSVLNKDDLNYNTYMLFNHRRILEVALSIPRIYKLNNTLVYEIINKLWPQMNYYIPNSKYSLGDYYAYNFKNLIELNSANLQGYSCTESSREVKAWGRIGRYNAVFGYANNIVKQGDIVEFSLNLAVKPGIYLVQVEFCIPSTCKFKSSFCGLYIEINNIICYKIDSIGDYQDKNNQVNIAILLQEKSVHKFVIKLKALKNYNAGRSGCCGLLELRNINIVLQNNYDIKEDKPIVVSTKDILNSMIQKK